MKTPLCLLASILLAGSLGCTMCAHPFDYSYAAYDEAQMSGHRAGSAMAPYTTTSVISEGVSPTPPAATPSEEEISEEILYYDYE